MNQHSRSGILLGLFVIIAMVPIFAASQLAPQEEPWPALLSNEAVQVEPAYAELQDRANASLARVLRTETDFP